jgi:hypothetical protein
VRCTNGSDLLVVMYMARDGLMTMPGSRHSFLSIAFRAVALHDPGCDMMVAMFACSRDHIMC